jgi:predicted secreted protein
MAPESAATDTAAECEAMASVDSDEFIIAYPCQDDAWLATPLGNARSLDEWR